MFSQNKKIRYQRLLQLDSEELNEFIKRYTNYLRSKSEITSNIVLNGFFVLDDVILQKHKKEALRVKYISKNNYIIKYSEEISNLYKKGFGYVKISSLLKVNHNVSVSKSSIERFIKANKISRD